MKKTVAYAVFSLPGLLGLLLLGGCGSSSGASHANGLGPSITAEPANQTAVAGQNVTFSVEAAGTTPLIYQWRMNGSAINGATSPTYTTSVTSPSQSGSQFSVVVSNNSGSTTSNAATLTVSNGGLAFNPSSAELAFGTVNVGLSSTLDVTFTNSGTTNVTVSNVSISGAGFNASGVFNGQIVPPGQIATLVVTFAPATTGAATGGITVVSDAPNSPTTIAVDGNGGPQGGAISCGVSGDSSNHIPNDWSTFVPPAKGQSYVDATFGCTVTRVTDVSSDDWSGTSYLPETMGYSTVSPFNANDTYLMLEDGWNRHFVTDLQGNSIVSIANMPAENDGWMLWDATNPNVFYYTNGNSLMQGTVNGSAVTTATLHQFSEYSAINLMDDTDVSQDGQHIAIVGGDTTGSSPENVFIYNFVANTKGPVYTTTCTGSVNAPNNDCLHKVILTPDNNALIDFDPNGEGPEQGDRLWTGNLQSDPLTGPTYLLPLQSDITNHSDAGSDMNGNVVFVEMGNSSTVPGFTNPCPSGWGLDVRQVYNPTEAVCLLDNQPSWHVGYRGSINQPWVGLSFFDARTSSPEWFDNSPNYTAPNSSTWLLYEDEIMVARIDANNNSSLTYRLARAYSRSDEDYNAQPHGAISRDGKYIAFQSDMAFAHTGCPANFDNSTDCTDVYVIKIQ